MTDQDNKQLKPNSHHYLIAFTTGTLSILIALATDLSFWTWIIIWVVTGVLLDMLLRVRH